MNPLTQLTRMQRCAARRVESALSVRQWLGAAVAAVLVAALALGVAYGPLTTSAQTATSAPAAAATPAATTATVFTAGEALVVNTDALNLRAADSTSAAVTAVLPTGTAVTIVSGPVSADGYSWYQVTTASGTGYVDGEYLAKSVTTAATPSFTAGQQLAVNTDGLNLRASGTTSAAVSAVLPAGTSVTIVSGPVSAGGYSWYQVTTAAGSGYVAGEYLAAPTTGAFAVGQGVVVATDALNLRAAPTTSAAVDFVLLTGDWGSVAAGPVSADGHTWYQIATSAGTGWVAGEYLARD